MKDEEKASGISPEETELDIAIQDILERVNVYEETMQKKKNRKG